MMISSQWVHCLAVAYHHQSGFLLIDPSLVWLVMVAVYVLHIPSNHILVLVVTDITGKQVTQAQPNCKTRMEILQSQ